VTATNLLENKLRGGQCNIQMGNAMEIKQKNMKTCNQAFFRWIQPKVE
jgi:hypothetical protein